MQQGWLSSVWGVWILSEGTDQQRRDLEGSQLIRFSCPLPGSYRALTPSCPSCKLGMGPVGTSKGWDSLPRCTITDTQLCGGRQLESMLL